MPREPLAPEIRQQVLNQALSDLSAQRIALLATYPPGEHFQRLRGMGFVHEGWTIYMSTVKTWQKAKEITANPSVTVLVTNAGKRVDHFIQIDCQAVEVTGEEFAYWQEKRYEKEGAGLRAVAERVGNGWIGWRMDPQRVRAMGYIDSGAWREAPVVFTRKQLASAAAPRETV